MEPKINYVALLILIILGVAVGNLASSFITAKYSYKEHEKQAAEVPVVVPANKPASIPKPTAPAKTITTQETIKLSPEANPELNIEPELTEKPANTKQLIEQRKLDENGIRLAKKCNEWTVVHKDMNTPSSERGMNKHCSEYYDYLSFGNLPETN